MATTLATASRTYADLDMLNYGKLKIRDARELERLVQVGKADGGRGLFFLDLRGPTAGETLVEAQALYRAVKKFFDRPQEENNGFRKESVDDGYVVFTYA